MKKCRICLKEKKNVRSIFDSTGVHTFAEIIQFLTNIKIVRNDGITESVCSLCCKNLEEFYEFKALIQRSDASLHNMSNSKKIFFNDLKDFKIKIEIVDTEEILSKQENSIKEYFKTGDSSIHFKDTIIKKVYSTNICDIKYAPIPVLDFLETIQEDSELSDDNFDDDYLPQLDDHKEYFLPLTKRCKKIYKKYSNLACQQKNTNSTKNRLKRSCSNAELKNVYINPVLLDDIRVLRTKCKMGKMTKKYIMRKKKMEMCCYCGLMTPYLKHHLLTHIGQKSHKCDVCGKGFLTLARMKTHKAEHSKEKKFKCDQCVAAFKCDASLKSHKLTHSDQRQYVCDICNKAFKRKGGLTRHTFMHNIANKNFKCDLCNMTFFTKPTLNHHLRVHTRERPYKCEICSQPYSYKHDFNRHCFKKHGVFLKQRVVNIMNEEVLKRERALMRELMLRMQGFTKEGEPSNPFAEEGPKSALAFEQAIKMLQSKQIPIDYNF